MDRGKEGRREEGIERQGERDKTRTEKVLMNREEEGGRGGRRTEEEGTKVNGKGHSSPWLPEYPLSLWPLQGEDHVTGGHHHPGDGQLGVALCLQLHHLLQRCPEHRGMERGTLHGGMRDRPGTCVTGIDEEGGKEG